jgi:hypothetical protein
METDKNLQACKQGSSKTMWKHDKITEIIVSL